MTTDCEQAAFRRGYLAGYTDGKAAAADTITTPQAAAMLGVSEQRVRAMVRKGPLDAEGGRDGRAYNITLASVEARIAASPRAGRPVRK
jgi:hypothetical protein